MPYPPDVLGPRSVFLGLGASLRGGRVPSEAPFLASVPLLARALRLERISVLKLDCEGCECAGRPSWACQLHVAGHGEGGIHCVSSALKECMVSA